MPFGAAIGPEGVHFRLWAPAANRVEVGVGPDDNITWHDMTRDVDGFLARLRGSHIALLRAAYDALHQLVFAAWYGDPGAWNAIGYDGPPVLA